MAIPRPRSGLWWLLSQASTYQILAALFASAIGIASAFNYWTQQRHGLAWLAGIGTALVVVFTVAGHGLALMAARKKDSLHELEGCLYTLHGMLLPPDSRCKVRLAVHLPLPNEESFEQLTEYIGDDPKPG